MAPQADPDFRAAVRKVAATLAVTNRLLDLSDIEWVRRRLGSKAAARLRREHRAAFLGHVRALGQLAAVTRRELSASGEWSLEQTMRFDAEVRWLLIRLRLWGSLAYFGVPVCRQAQETLSRFSALVAPSPLSALPARS